MKVKSEREVAQLCPTLCDPMDCSPPGSSVHGIFQARVLESGAIAFSVFICILHLIYMRCRDRRPIADGPRATRRPSGPAIGRGASPHPVG